MPTMPRQITPAELATRLAAALPPRLLDVRQPGEHARAALPDSRLIPLNELPGRVAELGDWRGADIVVYCHHGVRSLHAAEFLGMAGFDQVASLTGGIDAWSVNIDPRVPRY